MLLALTIECQKFTLEYILYVCSMLCRANQVKVGTYSWNIYLLFAVLLSIEPFDQ